MTLREINLRCQQLENELDELNLGEDDLEQRGAIIKQLTKLKRKREIMKQQRSAIVNGLSLGEEEDITASPYTLSRVPPPPETPADGQRVHSVSNNAFMQSSPNPPPPPPTPDTASFGKDAMDFEKSNARVAVSGPPRFPPPSRGAMPRESSPQFKPPPTRINKDAEARRARALRRKSLEKTSAAAHSSPSESQQYDFDILQSVLRTTVMKVLQRYPVFPLPRFKLGLRAVTGPNAQPNCWRSGIPLTVHHMCVLRNDADMTLDATSQLLLQLFNETQKGTHTPPLWLASISKHNIIFRPNSDSQEIFEELLTTPAVDSMMEVVDADIAKLQRSGGLPLHANPVPSEHPPTPQFGPESTDEDTLSAEDSVSAETSSSSLDNASLFPAPTSAASPPTNPPPAPSISPQLPEPDPPPQPFHHRPLPPPSPYTPVAAVTLARSAAPSPTSPSVGSSFADFYRKLEGANKSINSITTNLAAIDDSNAVTGMRAREASASFLRAVIAGDLATVASLLRTGLVHIHSSDDDGYTAILHAAKHGHADLVEVLLRHKAMPSCRATDGLTPLLCAAKNGHTDVVLKLLHAGAGIEEEAPDGAGPMFLAAESNWAQVLRLLLQHKADCTRKRVRDGWYPLHVAARHGFEEVVEILLSELEQLRTPLQVTARGETAADLAKEYGHTELAKKIALAEMHLHREKTEDVEHSVAKVAADEIGSQDKHATFIALLEQAGFGHLEDRLRYLCVDSMAELRLLSADDLVLGGVDEDLANEVCHFAAHYTDKVYSDSVVEEHEESTVSDEEVAADPDELSDPAVATLMEHGVANRATAAEFIARVERDYKDLDAFVAQHGDSEEVHRHVNKIKQQAALIRKARGDDESQIPLPYKGSEGETLEVDTAQPPHEDFDEEVPGWVERTDAAGNMYSYNTVTGEKKWGHSPQHRNEAVEPDHQTEYYDSENAHDAHDYSNADPDNAWVECYDEHQQAAFWWNEVTGEATWDDPFQDPHQPEALPPPPPAPSERTPSKGLAELRSMDMRALEETPTTGSPITIMPSTGLASVAASWVPDEEVTACQECHTAFNLINRRHHCRACGRVVCNKCSPNKLPLHPQNIVMSPSEISSKRDAARLRKNARASRNLQLARVCKRCEAHIMTLPTASTSQLFKGLRT